MARFLPPQPTAERAKESTLSVAMVFQSARSDAASGATVYDFEYELDSTRGRKRVMSTGQWLPTSGTHFDCSLVLTALLASSALLITNVGSG